MGEGYAYEEEELYIERLGLAKTRFPVYLSGGVHQ